MFVLSQIADILNWLSNAAMSAVEVDFENKSRPKMNVSKFFNFVNIVKIFTFNQINKTVIGLLKSFVLSI